MAARALRVTSGPSAGRSVEVDREIVVGRDSADLTIDDAEMSRRHAVVRPVERGVEIEDLGSMNGTFVNGRQISGAHLLTTSGTLKVGTSRIDVELAPPPARPPPTRAHEAPAADPPQATRVPAAAAAPDVTAAGGAEAAPQPAVTVVRDVPPPPVGGDSGSERSLAKAGLTAIIFATIGGIPASVLHPQPTPGDDNPRAFLETIVPSDTWAYLHLVSFIAFALSVAFFLALYRSLSQGPGAYFGRLGYASALISVAAAAVWVMLDGFAMKEIADDWAAAAGAERVAVEQSAFALEHFILSLFSLNVALWAGVTFLLFGLAVRQDGRWPAALGPTGIAAGAAALLIGVIQLFTERTTVVTHILVPVIYVVVNLWLVATAVIWWRRVKARPS